MPTPTMRQTTAHASHLPGNALRRLPAVFVLISLLTLVGGCLYRMPIQQGNFLDPSQVVRLENGMTKSQVKFLLGTPMVPNGFDSDRWDYFYYIKDRTMKEPISKRLTVYFKDDKVDHFDRPEDTAEAAAAMTAANEAAIRALSTSGKTIEAPSTLPKIPEARPQPRR